MRGGAGSKALDTRGARPERAASRAARSALVVVGCLLVAGVLARPAAASGLLTIQLDTAGPGTTAGLWLSRVVNHLALAVTVGCLLVPAWLLEARGHAVAATSAAAGHLGRRAARAGAVAAAFWGLGALGVFVFGVSNAAARPLPEAIDGALLSRFAETRFGTALLLQVGLALVVLLLAATSRGRSGARLTLVVTLIGALGPAWWGHAGTAQPMALAVVSDWLHIGGASVWVGGLLALTVLVLPRRSGLDPFAPTVRFSGLAGWSIVLVGATGMINTFLHVTDPEQLVETTWGRLSLAKALLLLGLAGFGWAHRRRFIPRLRSGQKSSVARSAFMRVAGVELVVMLVAVGLATSMASGLPAGVEASARIQTFTVPLGAGFAEVSLDPARAGANELHLYLYDPGNDLREVDDASVLLRSGEDEVEPRLLRSGRGHFTAPAVQVPSAGTWEVLVRVEADGQTEEVRGSLTLR